MPTASDLVTDLPADFEVFGQAVDTSLADLKGGTTGQVLSKATNADMDFTWVTSDDANAIQNAIVDAKGDLIAASAADTPARLAVGNNGETLVADSSTSTGLRWQGSIAAGKNAIINGGMDIWQRGTSFTNPGTSGTVFSADRWVHYFNGNGTVTQETTVKPDTSTFAMKITATASSSDNAAYQLIEQLQMEQFRGKSVTLSIKLAGTATLTPGISASYSTTANDNLFNTSTSISMSIIANPTLNTSTYVTYISQFTVPTTAKTLRININSNTMANTNVLYIAEAQLELGSTSTTFSRAGGTIQGELAACQRYYYRNSDSTTNYASFISAAITANTTQSDAYVPLPVTMRTKPSSVDFANLQTYDYVAGAAYAISNVTINANSSPNIAVASLTFATATAGRFIVVRGNNSSSAYLGFSAEL